MIIKFLTTTVLILTFTVLLYTITLQIKSFISKAMTTLLTDRIINEVEVSSNKKTNDFQRKSIRLLYTITVVDKTSIYAKMFIAIYSIVGSSCILLLNYPPTLLTLLLVSVVGFTVMYIILCETYLLVSRKIQTN